MASSIVHLTDNLDLIPGTFDLMLLPKLTRSWTFENESRLLATLLAPLKSDYDLIIIDTVPTPSVYTNNAIVASDYVMIPLQAEEESTNNIQNYISYLIDLHSLVCDCFRSFMVRQFCIHHYRHRTDRFDFCYCRFYK